MARIPEAELERLKREVSLVRLIQSQGHELKKRGKDWVMHCVFHDENTPSLSVSDEKNLYHTGKVNPDAMHKAISKYLPPMVGGKQENYTSGQIREGLQKAYGEIGRPELFDSVKHLIR